MFARLPGVPFGVGVEVVGVDLELHGPDGAERLGLDDRHVVRGADRRAADVASCRPSDIGHPGAYAAQDGLHEALLLHLAGQGEGVSASHADGLCRADHGCGILGAVYGAYADAELGEAILYLSFVFGVGEGDGGVGYENQFVDACQEALDFGQRVAQVFLAGVGGIRDEE